jgi:hypothetical protein
MLRFFFGRVYDWTIVEILVYYYENFYRNALFYLSIQKQFIISKNV